MRTAITILTVIVTNHCYAQELYNTTLASKLDEIKNLTSFDNSPVVFDEDSSYGSDFPRWNSADAYFQDDIVTIKGGLTYLAVADNKGKNPTTSPNEWQLYRGRHPYLFLRDTAKTEDLEALLSSDHPYIRTYAVAALAYRKYSNLFQVVIDNLKDTTKIVQYTGDYGSEKCPADLMLSYTTDQFSSAQKDILKKLILTRYTHLNTLDEVLLFHQPTTDSYPFVRAIANKGIAGMFGLIALSRYCKPEDIGIIWTGFKLDTFEVYYRGYKVFFKAIENCPDKSFKDELIRYKAKETNPKKEADEYYVRALASYKDNDCLDVLRQIARQESKYKDSNLIAIYGALKKHYSPIYDGLIKEIQGNLSEGSLQLINNSIEKSTWNY